MIEVRLDILRQVAALMPMHLAIDRRGRILSRGKTLEKVVGNAARLDEVFACTDQIGQSIGFDRAFARLGSGERVFLQMKRHQGISLRGQGVALSCDLIVLNLGFGIALSLAVREFGLTDSDFPPSDLAIEFLFLHEANRAALSELSRVNARLERAREDAQILSITDPLTGLLNRRGFEAEFARAFEQREDNPFALVHLDLDHFKEVNDRLGHAAGDRVLTEVAAVLSSEVRASDKVCRVGGDEFLLLIFSHRARADILRVCRRIIERIEAMRFHPSSARVSASIGVAVSDLLSQPRPDLLFDMADSALYHAKSNGKGKALLWGGPTETAGA